MAPLIRTQAKYHVLLVGIDDYQVRPLDGCVNDIDAVQRLLLGPRMGIAKDRIRRLASPHPGAPHETAVAAQPATLANLRAALAALGSDKIAAGDRVFIYYSGHGARVPVTGAQGQTFHREALVPVDGTEQPHGSRLLFDFELNELLRAIVARTRSVTLVLDCCHAAGVTRDGVDTTGQTSRFLDLARDLQRSEPLRDPAGRGRAGAASKLGGDVDDCHVVSACLGHEVANEDRTPGGARHGLFTRALVTALEATDEPDLPVVTWGRIWQAMRADIERHNPSQHPWMAGNTGRAVFAGPPVDGDPGFAVVRDGDRYAMTAGTLANVTPDALVAIYGEHPAYFPPRDLEADRAARVGVLRVISADRATATAEPVGTPFALPPGARGRLVKAGAAARLRYAVTPAHQTLEADLAASPLLERVELSSTPRPAVWLEHDQGRWFVRDSLHGMRADEPILFALQPAELAYARAVLEHYYAYSQPLRLAERATDLAGGLEITVLSYPSDRELGPAEAQEANLPEAPSRNRGTYTLGAGARVCFRVRNTSPHRLRVTLLNSAASGKVQMLGDQIVDAHSFYVFWANNNLGSPFQISPPREVTHCIDRMVAIGRTAMAHDLGHLRVDKTFAQIVQRLRGDGRDLDGPPPAAAPLDQWTATQVVLETRGT